MYSQSTQIRVTLPLQLQGFLQNKANKFGLSLSAYIRNLILNDVKDVDYPVFSMSKKTVKDLAEAKKAERNNELILVKDVEKFMQKL